MYEPPKARLEDAPEARGSVLAGLFAGWGAILMGVGLCVVWFGIALALAEDAGKPVVALLACIGLAWLVAPTVGLVFYLLRVGRSLTVTGVIAAAATGVAGIVVVGTLAAWKWPLAA
jgi:hypothetical protein